MRRALVALVLAALAAAGCAAAPASCPDLPPRRAQFLLVNDVYRLDPDDRGRGGLARVATLVRRLRSEADHTLFVLAGDTLSPSPLSALLRGRQMIEAWNALGLDAATFGNHEFDWGPVVLGVRMSESRFAWVSANVEDAASGRPFGGARDVLRLEWSGARVGVVGLTTPEAAATSNPGPAVRFASPAPAARRALDEMGDLDLRVAVTHLPLRRDRELATDVPLHLILGGHDHDPLVADEGATLIVKAGADAVNVAQVEFDLDCRGRPVGRRHRLIPVDASTPPAPDVAALVARYAQVLERELGAPAGHTRVPLDAREGELRRQETALGRFLAEVMRARVGGEVALLNAGAVRSNRVVPAGPVTRRDVYAILPFANTIALVEVPGAALEAALEHSVDALPRPAAHHLQTSGVTYTLDAAGSPGARVTAIRVQGQPLDRGRMYRVAVPDYLALGKDGYPMLAAGRVLLAPEDGPGLLQAVLEALAEGRSP